jgi:glycosyltransferase involved in cell wall biosynthesis
LKIAFLTTDSREHFRDYQNETPYFGTAPAALLQGFEALGEPQVHVISCAQTRMTSPEKLSANICFHGIRVPKWGWLRSGYLGCVLATRRILQAIQPDLVHGQGTERDCAISAVLSGFPSVLTIHGNMAELARLFRAKIMSFYWLAARLENFTLPRTSGVFCNSVYTQDLVRPRTPKTWLVPNPLGLAFFENTGPRLRKESTPVLLVVGVVCPRKRQQELMGLFRELRSTGGVFRVRWIGHCPRDPYGKKFLNMLAQPECSAWNFFVGPLDQPALIQELDSASALVHFPSEESFGLVAAEALARGLKVFSSKVGGLQEICAGPTDAGLIPPEDWPGLRSAIASWLRLGCHPPNESPKIMKTRYHPEVIAHRHIEIYREVISLR